MAGNKWWLSLGVAVLSPALSVAAGPTAEDFLRRKPTQESIVYDNPAADRVAEVKVEPLKKPQAGVLLRDQRGLVIRRFVDTNGDGVIDQFSYYMNGQEVFRDIDSDFDEKPDQCRWYHTGGSRWAKLSAAGKVEKWLGISAEEAAAEVVAAISAQDLERLGKLLISGDDAQAIGLGAEAVERLQKARGEANARFRSLVSAVGQSGAFNKFDGHNPMMAPGTDVGSTKDVQLYANATIIVDVGGKTLWLRAAELVRVGDTWKLTEVPMVIDNDRPLQGAGVLLAGIDNAVVTTKNDANETMVEEGEEIQKFVTELQKHDQMPPDNGDPKAIVAYHTRRAELCAHIGAKSQKKLKNREHWYKQAADSLNAAVQTGAYPQGITMLGQYAEQFAKTTWGKDLAAYFKYRAINAAYALRLSDAGADQAKEQERFLGELRQFIEAHPQAEDCADALWQLGNGMEFAVKDADAKAHYKQLVEQFPKAPVAAKAAGAIRRIDAVGQPFDLVGASLMGEGKIAVSQLQGNVVLVSFWSTWCEPCKAEMPRLVKLREKYKAQGFEIVGVNLDNDKSAATAYSRKAEMAWPQIHEPGSMESPAAVQYGIISLPCLVLIDADGRVINRNLPFNQLEVEVEKAVAKKVASSKN